MSTQKTQSTGPTDRQCLKRNLRAVKKRHVNWQNVSKLACTLLATIWVRIFLLDLAEYPPFLAKYIMGAGPRGLSIRRYSAHFRVKTVFGYMHDSVIC